MVGEPAGAHQHPRLERSDGLVVGIHRSAQPLAEPLHVLCDGADAGVQLPPKLADLAGVLCHLLLLPAVVTARSSAISVVGVAVSTRWSTPCWVREGSASGGG